MKPGYYWHSLTTIGDRSMTWETEAVRQYAYAIGSENTERAWILSPFDTWEPNPFYIGEPQPHPNEENYED
jgi:hypothetical protein